MNTSALAVSTLAEEKVPLFVAHGNLVSLPETFNYIGVFLSFRCPYSCSYCINRFGETAKLQRRELSAHKWIDFFSRLSCRDVPVTLQGGEPGMHRDFIEIVKETAKFHHVDILTNLAFDLEEFTRKIDPSAINRDAPYAPIRVSYHPEQFHLDDIIRKVKYLMDAGFRVGVYGVMHPLQITAINHAKTVCADLGIDFRTKPFLGKYYGTVYGDFAYSDACSSEKRKRCECAPSELLIAPDGFAYPCHHNLYNGVDHVGHVDDQTISFSDEFRPCSYYGHCNPCDVKVKNNRFQQFGHVSVRIRSVS